MKHCNFVNTDFPFANFYYADIQTKFLRISLQVRTDYDNSEESWLRKKKKKKNVRIVLKAASGKRWANQNKLERQGTVLSWAQL